MDQTSVKRAVEAYRRNGFAMLPSAFPPQHIQCLLEMIEAIQASLPTLTAEQCARLIMERDLPAAKRNGLTAELTGDAIFIIGEPPAFDYRFAELMLYAPLIGMIQQLLQCQDVRYHLSNVTMKRGQVGSGIAWHRDFPNRYICPADASFLRLMVCLDGMDSENGATEFVPGSHLLSDSEAARANAAHDASNALARKVSVSCPPGSLVFIHPKVVHGGPPNTSERHRRNLVMQWGRGAALKGEETLSGYSVDEVQAWIAQQR